MAAASFFLLRGSDLGFAELAALFVLFPFPSLPCLSPSSVMATFWMVGLTIGGTASGTFLRGCLFGLGSVAFASGPKAFAAAAALIFPPGVFPPLPLLAGALPLPVGIGVGTGASGAGSSFWALALGAGDFVLERGVFGGSASGLVGPVMPGR